MEKTSKRTNDTKVGCLCACACTIIFGFSYLFTKNVTSYVSEFALLGWRFVLAAFVMGTCALTGVVKIHLRGKNMRPLFAVALFSPVIYYTGETFGVSNTTASESGAFIACIPVISLIASTLILKKKPRKQQVAGILVSLAGVLITVFALGVSSSLSVPGYLALSIAVTSYALYSVFVEKARGYTGEEITFVMLLSGAIFFGIMALAEGIHNGTVTELISLPFTDVDFLIACIYLGVGCSVVAFFLSNVAISKIGVNRTCSFTGIATLVSIVSGIVMLKESFTAWQVVGAVLIIAGVYIANSRYLYLKGN